MTPENYILAWTKSPFTEEIQKEAQDALKDLKKGIVTSLSDAYSIPLAFGTGGIRGKIGNGIGRMNDFTVGRAAYGFAQHIKKQKKPSLVIAYDSRRRSLEFAQVTAGIFASLGIPVKVFPKPTPTPLLSYAIRHFKASGGVVITASHNPPEYNGFKAYLDDGGQLVPPDDKIIIKLIESIQDWDTIPFLSPKDPKYKKLVTSVPKSCFESYLKELKKAGLTGKAKSKTKSKIQIVYSPLHGTGGEYMKKALKDFGYKKVFLVPEQAKPNGEFPTVSYPNPEEKDALALCEKYSKNKKAELFLATDPDADRLGVGIREANGSYTIYNGNQIGSILSAFLCEKYSKSKKKLHLIKTIVTTDLQENIAKANGVACKNVLTGFKYIAEEMKVLDKSKTDQFLFGGEESYGYLPIRFVRDKDSIASAILFTEILAEKGKISEYLDEIYLNYGLFREGLASLTLEGSQGQAKIQDAIYQLRKSNLIGKKIGERTVVAVLDFENQKIDGKFSGKPFRGMPKSNVVQVVLSGQAKLTIRPSGTEPKVKIYSSYRSIQHPVKKDEIADCWNQLGREITQAEKEFIRLAGLS